MSKITPRPNRKIKGRPTNFHAAKPIMSSRDANAVVEKALRKWDAPSAQIAEKWRAKTEATFPDQFAPEEHWDEAVGLEWSDFFTWGHDHNFGFGVERSGAMSTRHLEIASEAIAHGMLPKSLKGKKVLDIGCWSGGDLLLLSGMGADVTAVEGHPLSAKAARLLCKLVGCDTKVIHGDAYQDKKAWQGQFDVIYCSGVIYHVTDPVLLLRICFAYLKVGGRLVIETKAMPGSESHCSYSGSREKGWNWFAPTRQTLGRWLADVGFDFEGIKVKTRPNGRLLAAATKEKTSKLPDSTGLSRPGSWLSKEV